MSTVFKDLKQYSHTHIGLDTNELSNLSDYGELDTIEFYPVINRDNGIKNRVEYESYQEKIYTKKNADRISNKLISPREIIGSKTEIE